MMLDSFAIVTLTIALLAAVYSMVLRYVLYEIGGMNKIMERNKEIQKEMREINKKYINAARARRDNELRQYEQKMNSMAVEMLQSQIRIMIITLPLLLVSAFIANELRAYFPEYTVVLPLHIPLPQLNLENLIIWRNTFGAVGWFWIMFILFSFVAQFVINKKNSKNTTR